MHHPGRAAGATESGRNVASKYAVSHTSATTAVEVACSSFVCRCTLHGFSVVAGLVMVEHKANKVYLPAGGGGGGSGGWFGDVESG